MKVPKPLSAGAIVVIGLLLIAGVVYWQAGRRPENYRPSVLTQSERDDSAGAFVNEMAAIHNRRREAEGADLYTRTFSEAELNRYLASLDEIAYLRVGRRRGEVREAMERASLEGIAVTVNDGGLTLMIRAVEYDKVLSADLALAMTDDGALTVRLVGASVGRLAVPVGLIRDRLAELKRLLPAGGNGKGDDGKGATVAGVKVNELERALTVILAAIDGEPIRPSWTIEGLKIGLEKVDAAPGRLALQFSRVRANGKAK